jgi:hypothetical protein
MRLHTRLAALTVACFLGISGTASAKAHHKPAYVAKSSSNPDYKFIKAAYDYRSYGFVTRDCNRIYSYTTPDYVDTDLQGKRYDKTGCLKEAYAAFTVLDRREGEIEADFKRRGGQEISNVLAHKVTISSFTVKGNTAVVMETQSLHSNMHGVTADGKDHAESLQLANNVYRDVWVRSTQGWLQQSGTQIK